MALIVADLRLVTVEAQLRPLAWITTRATLQPGSEDGFAFATPFAVAGRGTREVVAEFGDDLGWFPDHARKYRMTIEAQVHPGSEWVRVAGFDWWTPPTRGWTEYVTYRNEFTVAPPRSKA